MKVLQLTAHFSPNVGGVETHLNDLVDSLLKRQVKVYVLTYRPLQSKVDWKIFERKNNCSIFRIPWFPGLFYNLVRKPIFEFFYLTPGLFFISPFVILFFNPNVIHTHGLIAGAVGVFWGKVFGKRVITTTHSVYEFPKKGLYREFSKAIFNFSNEVLTLSKKAKEEIVDLGVPASKVKVFTYWIDLNKFKLYKSKLAVKSKVNFPKGFIVFFVGRLIPEKGVNELIKAVKIWSNKINLVIAGTGPLEDKIKNLRERNIKYVGSINNDDLPLYYSASDILIVPSTHEEGFGRVILESLACGTPVVAANRGAIPEAMDETVGRLITVTPTNIKNSVEDFYKHPSKLKKLARIARNYAVKRYSEGNVNLIIDSYEKYK